MADFRKIVPKRSINVPIYKTYTAYKPLLRKDFHEHCGYCGDHDFFRDSYYEINHFVPKKCLVNISETAYSNLVYSCRSCNNSKRNKWPTKDENVHNNGVEGFIDPCDPAYSDQFERMEDGSIRSVTILGDWMWSALNLGNPIHRVKWMLEEFKILLNELDKIASETCSKEELEIIIKLNAKYRELEDELRGPSTFR